MLRIVKLFSLVLVVIMLFSLGRLVSDPKETVAVFRRSGMQLVQFVNNFDLPSVWEQFTLKLQQSSLCEQIIDFLLQNLSHFWDILCDIMA